jgi:hypothetical protein
MMVAGMVGLIVQGEGLPMNAFPPRRLVRSGIFRWVANPIYIGFGLLVAGVAIGVGSSAGVWLGTPFVVLAMSALVLGYERHDLVQRFGSPALEPPRLCLPRAGTAPATWEDRAAVLLRVMLPWVIVYFAVEALGRAPDSFVTTLPLERSWRVIQSTELVYASTYVFVPVTPLLILRRGDLRDFALRGLVATVLVTLCWLVIPVVADNRPFVPDGVLGELLAFEQRNSRGVATFPAFHVLWALIAAQGWIANARATGRDAWRWIGVGWAAAITLSTLTTAMHSLVDVAAAIIVWMPIRDPGRSWQFIRHAAESLANAWREWRFGPVRVINHGAFAAAAAGVGLLVAGSALGAGREWAVIIVGFGILLGAGALAQWLEGSPKLLRPFGWYGGVIGGLIGAFVARWLGQPIIPLLASFAIAAPWIQSLGRLRCLVQGCCHGSPAPGSIGIEYRHPRSRVMHLADLAGRPLHATPLYSIAANVVIGVLLVRLRTLAAPDPFILGGYLMASGIARFVEESYRGEPQTPIIGGLRLYQWLAVVSVVAGMVCFLLPGPTHTLGFTVPTGLLMVAAVAMALLTGFMMGVDFPTSNARFARLAPAD